VDYGQKNDVIAQHPEVVKELSAAFDKWWAECLPLMVNEKAVGPKLNPFAVRYWEQFGGGPTEADYERMDPDDMGYGEPGCYRPDTKLKTPNLDHLAAAGMRFTDAHSASAVCTPTRYGLLTGRYPSRIGQYGVLTTFNPPIIPKSRLTVASFLKQHGYETACIGKWHLGMKWEGKPGNQNKVPVGARISSGPADLGFDYFYGFTHARNIGTIIEQDRVVENVKDVENQPRMAAKAVEWIGGRKAGKPFFLFFPMCPPHTPVVPAPEFAGKSGAVDAVGKDPQYGDWVYQGDHMLGQLLDALEKNGHAGNTLVIATADNGAAKRPYPPLRASKTSIYEGGHRVPFVARWPGKIEPGSVFDGTICLNPRRGAAQAEHPVHPRRRPVALRLQVPQPAIHPRFAPNRPPRHPKA
jgi:arylsulfatase A